LKFLVAGILFALGLYRMFSLSASARRGNAGGLS
jgi:hypothetical protein